MNEKVSPDETVAESPPLVAGPPPPQSAMAAAAASILEAPEVTHAGLKFNLLTNRLGMEDEEVAVTTGVAVAETTSSTLPATPAAKPKARARRGLIFTIIAAACLLAGSAGAFVWHSAAPSPSPSAVALAPVATPFMTPTPSPSASPTPTATPVIAVPQTVSAPTIAPTTAHPQPVVVTSKRGIWLRSTPSSVNSKNIISWIPNGASASVDATGDFWWHGSYKGKTGYFASKFTQ